MGEAIPHKTPHRKCPVPPQGDDVDGESKPVLTVRLSLTVSKHPDLMSAGANRWHAPSKHSMLFLLG